MTENLDDIRKELEEVRKLKESLKEDVERLRKEREAYAEEGRFRGGHRAHGPPEPCIPPDSHFVDLSSITDGLDEMMEGLGEQIRKAVREVGDIGVSLESPRFMIRRMGKHGRGRIENIPAERVAQAVSPLGSEERLRILDILKDGGKSFNELETLTGKTGSSLTHHLTPLMDAGYVIKGEVRGTYYITVAGRLAYRLAQWLTSRVEWQRSRTGSSGEGQVSVSFDEEADKNKEGADVQ
ncbi:MAG: hypothetical protein C4K49_12765 [Candidatus Thorarchaeota archaeon]|nr:MAG: hypothetical protein C4K49_12765 [Candidatus Thorarchaeota archaeon]